MSHKHTVDYKNVNLTFLAGIILNLTYVIFEAGAGLKIGSTSLLSDAGHNFSDVLSLVLGGVAVFLLKKKARGRLTYGFKKLTVLTAFVNSLLLLVAVGIILWESIHKLLAPEPVSADDIIWVAGIGIVINALTAFLLFKWSDKDINIKAVFWHMVTDALVSAGVVVGGLVIKFYGLYWIDGFMGIIISLIILWSTWGLLKESFMLSIDAVPHDIDVDEITRALEGIPGVDSVHHIHLWAMSTTEVALTAHVVIDRDYRISELAGLNKSIKEKLRTYGVVHTTLEFEYVDNQCDDVC